MNEQELDKKIDDAMNAEPSFALPSNFAQKVVRIAEAREAAKETSRDGWWLAGGIVAILGAFVYAILSIEFKLEFGVFEFVSGNVGLIIFGVVFIFILNVIDRKILRKTGVNG